MADSCIPTSPKILVHYMFVGAAGRIAYSLIPLICDGSVFGKGRRIILRLIDIEMSMTKLEGIHHSLHETVSLLCMQATYDMKCVYRLSQGQI